MQIHLEASEKHSIKAYGPHEIQIDSAIFSNNVIANRHEILEPWDIQSITELNGESISLLLKHNPKIILIGHESLDKFPSPILVQTLANKGIALECMSIGAACRTYNILLGELRDVVIGIIF